MQNGVAIACYQRFYSTNFLVSKKTGELRPSLDQAVAGTGLAGRFTTIDLNDTYFNVEVAPKLRKFLHFAFRWVAYEYNRLPFGYSLVPRTLSKRVDMALQPCMTRA